jgi:hypothetical protein
VKSNLAPHTQQILEAEVARSRREQDLDPERPKERVALSDQRGLLAVDIRRVLADQVEIFDDRKP